MGFFYTERRQQHGEDDLTLLADLTPAMLGTALHPQLKTICAETCGLLLVVVPLLNKHAAQVGADSGRIAAVGACLIRYMNIIKGAGANVLNSTIQEPRACIRKRSIYLRPTVTK